MMCNMNEKGPMILKQLNRDMLLTQREYQLLFLLVVGEGVYEENMCSFLSCGKTEDGRWGSWKGSGGRETSGHGCGCSGNSSSYVSGDVLGIRFQ